MAGTTLLIERSPGETRAALRREGVLVQVDHYRHHAPALDGALFHGRVRRIEPGLNAAFVDLDGIQDGFLRARAVAGRSKRAAIADLLQEGAAIFVKVLGEAPEEAGKLPRVATLTADESDAALAGGPLPVAPACIDPGPSPVDRILAEHGDRVSHIVCNTGRIKSAVDIWCTDRGITIDVETGDADLFAEYGIDDEIDAALNSDVPLPGGARLTFEPGRTLCAVDLDSSTLRSAAGRGARDVNLAAVPEIARQLRLREIGGPVVIDFLKMERASDRNAVLTALREALSADPAECHVLGFSRLGLAELTRRRRRPSLAARLLRPTSAGAARPEAVACMLLRDLAGRSRRGAGAVAVVAAPVIVDLLDGAMADALAESVSWSQAKVTLRTDAARPPGSYEIHDPVVAGRNTGREMI